MSKSNIRYRLRYGIVSLNGGSEHNTLMLDYDTKRCPKLATFYAKAHIIGFKIQYIQFERSRRGWHITIVLNRDLDPAVRVALQALMGSDNNRETLNLMRVIGMIDNPPNKFWQKRWNLFYERKLQ